MSHFWAVKLAVSSITLKTHNHIKTETHTRKRRSTVDAYINISDPKSKKKKKKKSQSRTKQKHNTIFLRYKNLNKTVLVGLLRQFIFLLSFHRQTSFSATIPILIFFCVFLFFFFNGI